MRGKMKNANALGAGPHSNLRKETKGFATKVAPKVIVD
jgi:hypothetical protein